MQGKNLLQTAHGLLLLECFSVARPLARTYGMHGSLLLDRWPLRQSLAISRYARSGCRHWVDQIVESPSNGRRVNIGLFSGKDLLLMLSDLAPQE